MTPQQDEILFHLGYEWWMFRAAADILRKVPQSDDPVRNALVESLAIHGRGLVFFFANAKKFATDWNATDLGVVLETSIPTHMDEWRVHANLRVAHLTSARQHALSAWNVDGAQAWLTQRIDAVRAKVGADMPSPWIGDRTTTTSLLGAVGPVGPMGSPSGFGATGPARP
jgi:hypothetical protein